MNTVCERAASVPLAGPQRTLLPYRLRRDAVAEEILANFAWCEKLTAEINGCLHRLAIDPTQPGSARLTLRARLVDVTTATIADVLVEDYMDAARLVWLFEREHRFAHGFALVPLRKEAA